MPLPITQDEEAPIESKPERFHRIATRRTRAVLGNLRLLANCGNRGSYSYTPADVERLFDAIEKQYGVTRMAFEPRTSDVSLFDFGA